MGAGLLDAHAEVRGVDVARAEVKDDRGAWIGTPWAELSRTERDPGAIQVRVQVDGGASGADVQVPPCAGRGEVSIDGAKLSAPAGPLLAHVGGGTHALVLQIRVSSYERRVACGYPVRVGTRETTREGLGTMRFVSPHTAAGGGQAVVFVPPGHDGSKPATVLVGLHPWNGTRWTYAAYESLLSEAARKDVVLLLPSGLGNSLYTADAEDEVMRSLDALGSALAVDPRRVSVWGASMGGAGATTIGLHHPDRFASITSFFGDSQYDLTTYVKSLLHDEAGAHAVNALDVVDNARWVPVWLIHGEADHTSPIHQSEVLAAALQKRSYAVQFDRVPHMGHAGALVERFLSAVVDRAAAAQAPVSPPRVTYRGVRPWDNAAYGVRLMPLGAGDVFIDIERTADGVHVRRTEGLRAVALDPGALGTDPAHPPTITNDSGHALGAGWTGGAY